MSIRTAIVDDSRDIRLMLRLALEADGRFEIVAEAEDGHQALEVIADVRPELVVLDLAMPRLDGLEVLRALRARRWPNPVVVFSSFTDEVMVSKATELGAAAYVRKGTDITLMPSLLAAATGSSS